MDERDKEEIYQKAKLEMKKISYDILLDNIMCLLLIVTSVIAVYSVIEIIKYVL